MADGTPATERRADILRLGKPQRQHIVARLVEQHVVRNQMELVDLLAAEGVAATQTTVSRDLEDLGAIKVRLPGGDAAYAIPEHPTAQVAPEDHLRRVFGDWVVEQAAMARAAAAIDCRRASIGHPVSDARDVG